MSQSRIITVLVIAVIILVGAVMFLLGQRWRHTESSAPNTVSPEAKPLANVDHRTRPVQIGLDGSVFDACGSSGRARGLNPNGDNFLAVKASPDISSSRIDKLGPDDQFYICETTQSGRWTGIVYADGGQLSAKCGVSSPVSAQKPYSGPCKSGWVFSKYVELVAG